MKYVILIALFFCLTPLSTAGTLDPPKKKETPKKDVGGQWTINEGRGLTAAIAKARCIAKNPGGEWKPLAWKAFFDPKTKEFIYQTKWQLNYKDLPSERRGKQIK